VTGDNGQTRPEASLGAGAESAGADDERRQVAFVIGAIVCGFVLGIALLLSLVLFGM